MLSIAIGVWLTFTRLSFGSSGAMADSDHLVGLLVLTFTIIALAEVGRATRFMNLALGVWLITSPWLLDGIASPLAVWNGVICGALLIVLAIPRGRVKESYACWNRFVVEEIGSGCSQPILPGPGHPCLEAQAPGPALPALERDGVG
jgi:hypothetical protein